MERCEHASNRARPVLFSLLIHLVVPSEPIHIVYHALGQTAFPAFSHSGFADLIAAGRERLRTGDFFHQLHHRHFECNYGTIEMPWDQWFGSFDDGTKEGRLAQRTRVRAMGRTVGVNKPSRDAAEQCLRHAYLDGPQG